MLDAKMPSLGDKIASQAEEMKKRAKEAEEAKRVEKKVKSKK